MCCLSFAQKVYEMEYATFPKVDSLVETPQGRGVICESNFLTGKIKVKLINNVGKLDNPSLVLCNHGSFIDFVYAGKLLRKLNDDYTALLKKEEMSKDFLVSLGENPDAIRPEYDFCATQKELEKFEKEIRIVKHALNVFNSTTVIPEFDITIDEMLVLIPQLSKRKQKLAAMKGKLPKMREQGYARNSAMVEYRYLNYEVSWVESEYKKTTELLAKAQTALDIINNTSTLEIDL